MNTVAVFISCIRLRKRKTAVFMPQANVHNFSLPKRPYAQKAEPERSFNLSVSFQEKSKTGGHGDQGGVCHPLCSSSASLWPSERSQ